MKFESATLSLTVDDQTVVLKQVPAWVCLQCGEKVLSNEVAKQVEEILETVKKSPDHYQEIEFRAA